MPTNAIPTNIMKDPRWSWGVFLLLTCAGRPLRGQLFVSALV